MAGTPSPFVVAHRAGNDLTLLAGAERSAVPFVEADVRLFRGRAEVRHLKTVGPVPILWDRWRLANPFAARLRLDELLAAATGRSELMLDLKGRDRRLSRLVLEAIAPHAGRLPLAVCARSWPLLEPFRGLPGVRVVYSAGRGRELRRLLARGERVEGVSVHERLLDGAALRELRRVTDLVLTWPVNTAERARELVAAGVDGLISDRVEVVRAAL